MLQVHRVLNLTSKGWNSKMEPLSYYIHMDKLCLTNETLIYLHFPNLSGFLLQRGRADLQKKHVHIICIFAIHMCKFFVYCNSFGDTNSEA